MKLLQIKLITLLVIISFYAPAQEVNVDQIKAQIESLKNDVRGTYKSIRWFCNDGSVREPKDPCPNDIGGIQHATYKDEIVKLGEKNHLFFGQILAYTDKVEFWDQSHYHSRLKQYQLGKYLSRVDNGWINKKGQFYRGSVQIEDEQAWGVNFYNWLLSQDEVIKNNYFLILQSLKDIPHQGDDDLSQLMRAQSKVISDEFSKFMELRIKIHGNPEPVDIEKTEIFLKNNKAALSSDLQKKFSSLLLTMRRYHEPVKIDNLLVKVSKLNPDHSLTAQLTTYLKSLKDSNDPSVNTLNTSALLLEIRKALPTIKQSSNRLLLMDLVNQLESILFRSAADWKPITLSDQLNKIYALARAATGTGHLELWEWEKISATLAPLSDENISLASLTEKLVTARGVVEWSSSMIKANYQDIVNRYSEFEPKSYQFIDDKIRSSIVLQLGKSVGDLGAFISDKSSLNNKVLDLNNQSTIRGLNPGYAMGELVVVSGSAENIEVSSDKIYIFDRAPSDLKPVAGIATVAEGNLVSHVQLLARNLGIPNAALSDENLNDMKKHTGKKVFYAVSNRGNVILKPADQMSEEELKLFAKKVRKEEKISVPVQEIRLDQNKILNLRDVDADDSGKLCGPKAANLGQLKAMYTDQVVEGLVIPFGIFKSHMDQQMPGQAGSYWDFLRSMFKEAENKRLNGVPENEVEAFQLRQLETLRNAIKIMSLSADFIDDISKSFETILGKPIGEIPVFLRSDTNMEDLKDFTGAGLNLTIFNALDKNKILQGIKDVWASPYTERSFKWRQRYLLNPENVFPSILIIPSVDVDYSGVLITKGVSTGNESDLTIAFSRGAGGAVDGQAAESYSIDANGNPRLISPAREPFHNTLPASGGTGKKASTFQQPILNSSNMREIYNLALDIRTNMAKKTNSDYTGAYDVELGFKNDKLWLFQIRPFVENKNALGSDYLKSITPTINSSEKISLNSKI